MKNRYFWLWIGGVFGLILLESSSQASKAPARKLTLAELQTLARSAGFPDPSLAAAVAMAESGGNVAAGRALADPSALGDGGQSFGLWQIHAPDHPEFDRARLFDPIYNAAAALAISRQGADFTPWSAYKNGAYLKYMV